MAQPELRLWGDPLRGDPLSTRLRELCALAEAQGVRCAICLSAARGEVKGRAVPLTNGNREYTVYTQLEGLELKRMIDAGNRTVASSAPMVVFGDELALRQAALEFDEASLVLGGEGSAEDLLKQVLQHLSIIEHVTPRHAVSEDRLRPYLETPPPVGVAGPLLFLHSGALGEQGRAHGTDLVLEAFQTLWSQIPEMRLEIYIPERDPFGEQNLLTSVPADIRAAITMRSGAPNFEDLRRSAAVVQPLRRVEDLGFVVRAMAAARPVVISRFHETSEVLSSPGTCLPVGGRLADDGSGHRFEPDVRMVVDGMRTVLVDRVRSLETGLRGRRQVQGYLVAERPARTAVEPRGQKPLVVLEAPLFETSSSSLLTIQTALELQRRDRVDLRLKPSTPFQDGLAEFNDRAPSLVPLLSRRPGQADLWISTGWPPRVHRPSTRQFCVRIDWEYGALPAKLSPLVIQEADKVIVHSRAVRSVVAAAGCPVDRIELISHGVDGGVFHEDAPPLEEVLNFKRGRKALLFVGGLIWRKGVDLLLKALLQQFSGNDDVCLVVKPMGAHASYHGYTMEELFHRVRDHTGAPGLLLMNDTLADDEMAGLYRACDAMVHPYRGEGFCMPALEARACGLPLVITEGGSTDDFCNGSACLMVPAQKRPVELPGVHIGNPFVLEPDVDELAKAMREAVEKSESLRTKARAAAPMVRSEFNWSRAAEHIEGLAQQAMATCSSRLAEEAPTTAITPVMTS